MSGFTAATTSPPLPAPRVVDAYPSNTVLQLSCNLLPYLSDASSNAHALTAAGVPAAVRFNPFYAAATTPADVGSTKFNGTTDYLTVPSTSALGFGTGDFTIECWFNAAAATANVIWDQRALGGGASQSKPLIYLVSNTLNYWVLGSPHISVTPTLNVWNHVAVVRSASVTSMYLNGTLAGTWADTTDYGTSSDAAIGVLGDVRNSGYFTGYLSNIKVTKGTAVYTTNFTPSADPLKNDAGTSLLTLQTAQNISNSVVQDTSSANLAITATGSPVQGRFSPFGNGGYSMLFAGTAGSYMAPVYNTVLDQNGDFTYEGWFYYVTMPTTGYQNVLGNGNVNATLGLNVGNAATSNWSAPYKLKVNIAGGSEPIVGTTEIVAKKWYHFSLVRASNIVKLYINGVQEGISYTYATNTAFTAAQTLLIGQNSNAYFSNVRYVKGTAVYTSNFTVPTAPLTPITNTSLLTCQTPAMTDASNNRLVVNKVGAPVATASGPFIGLPAAGSVYLSTGISLTTPASTAVLGAGDFTVECWVNVASTAATQTFIANTISGNTQFSLDMLAGGQVRFLSFTSVFAITTTTLVANTWTHLAVVRIGTALTIYINGVSSATATNSTNLTGTDPIYIGRMNAGTNVFTGYIAGARIVVGTGVYTSSFTQPTSPPTAVTNTALLLNFTGAGVSDIAGKNTISTNAISMQNGVRKYNLSSYAFNGTSSYITIPNSASMTQVGSWTVEMWVYKTTTGAIQFVYCQGTSGYAQLGFTATGNPYIDKANTGAVLTSANVMSLNAWHHLAMSYNGTTLQLWMDGVSQGTVAFTGVASTLATYVGCTSVPSSYFSGYIDDIRITSGVNRYTAAFTPPTRLIAI